MADQGGFKDRRPTGMTVREQERRRRGDNPAADDPAGDGTVSERIERESVAGGHGHGGELDAEVERMHKEATQ